MSKKSERYVASPETTLPFQYEAPNAAIAQRVAAYLVSTFAHDEAEVAVIGLRVLYRTKIVGASAERLKGYIDGLNDALCGE